MPEIPSLPVEVLKSLEWTSDSAKYRFTNVGVNEWVVHRAHDPGFAAHLRHGEDGYDFITERGGPPFSASSISLGEAFRMLN